MHLKLETGERRVAVIRRHWWLVVRPVIIVVPPLVAIPAYSALDVAIPGASLARFSALFYLIDCVLCAILFLKWLSLDLIPWWMDSYTLTTRRLILQRGTVTVERREASLDAVHESTYTINGAAARFFDYGDLTIQTGGRGKGLLFRAVPHPQRLQLLIAAEARQARELGRHARGADGDISLALRRVFNGRAAVHDAPTEAVPLITAQAARLQRKLNLLPEEAVIYATRRHKMVLAAGVCRPLLAAGVAAAAMVFVAWFSPAFGAIFLVVALLWAAWEYVDWRDDVYVLTTHRFIGLNRRPLLFEMKAVVPLRSLSDVVLRVSSLGGRLLNVGSLTLETTADSLTLRAVPHPERLQHLVFQQMDELKRRDKLREQERLAGTLTDWFKEYHRMQDEAERAPGSQPGAGPLP